MDQPDVSARTVVLATGARYRKLPVSRVEEFEKTSIYYAATPMEAQLCVNDPVVVVGGGNSAGQATTFLRTTSRRSHRGQRGARPAADVGDSDHPLLVRAVSLDHRHPTGQDDVERLTRTALDEQHLAWLDGSPFTVRLQGVQLGLAQPGVGPSRSGVSGNAAASARSRVLIGSGEVLVDVAPAPVLARLE
jgi:hypothetical protein